MPKFPILVWYKIPRWKIFPSVKGYFLFFVNFVSFRTLQNSSNHASKLNLHVNIILILSKHRMDFLYSMNLFWNKWERLCTKAPNLAHFGTFLKGFPSAQAPCRDGQGLLWDCTEAWLFCTASVPRGLLTKHSTCQTACQIPQPVESNSQPLSKITERVSVTAWI